MTTKMDPRNRKTETPLMRESAYLADEFYQIIVKEKIFPKRSRWLFGKELATLMADFLTAIEEANTPKMQTAGLRIRRFEQQQIALGKLSAFDRLLTQATRSIPINPDYLEHIGKQINLVHDLLVAWVESDNTIYGPVSSFY